MPATSPMNRLARTSRFSHLREQIDMSLFTSLPDGLELVFFFFVSLINFHRVSTGNRRSSRGRDVSGLAVRRRRSWLGDIFIQRVGLYRTYVRLLGIERIAQRQLNMAL